MLSEDENQIYVSGEDSRDSVTEPSEARSDLEIERVKTLDELRENVLKDKYFSDNEK